MVKALPSNAGGMGSIPGQGAKIPHASWPKKTKHKKKERKKLKKEEIKKVQQNKMTVLDWVLPFWTLAPYSSKSSSPDGLFGVRRQSGAWHKELSGYIPADPGTKKEKAFLGQRLRETLTPEWQRTAVGKRVGA